MEDWQKICGTLRISELYHSGSKDRIKLLNGLLIQISTNSDGSFFSVWVFKVSNKWKKIDLEILFSIPKFSILNTNLVTQTWAECLYLKSKVHCVAYLYAVWPIYNAHVPEGWNEGGMEGPLPLAFQYLIVMIKTLWFEFGHDIFTGFKMPTL